MSDFVPRPSGSGRKELPGTVRTSGEFAPLIAKLEAAECGSRELDAEVAWATGWNSLGIDGHRWRDYAAICVANGQHVSRGAAGWKLPEYTTSLDAALTLVPEGHHWATGGSVECDQNPMRPGAMVYPQGSGDAVNVYAATPALALCITALKAREVAGCREESQEREADATAHSDGATPNPEAQP